MNSDSLRRLPTGRAGRLAADLRARVWTPRGPSITAEQTRDGAHVVWQSSNASAAEVQVDDNSGFSSPITLSTRTSGSLNERWMERYVDNYRPDVRAAFQYNLFEHGFWTPREPPDHAGRCSHHLEKIRREDGRGPDRRQQRFFHSHVQSVNEASLATQFARAGFISPVMRERSDVNPPGLRPSQRAWSTSLRSCPWSPGPRSDRRPPRP